MELKSFCLLFTILGSTTPTYNWTDQIIRLPLVYGLLKSKVKAAYIKEHEVIFSKALKYRIHFTMDSGDDGLWSFNNKRDEVQVCLFNLR